MCMIFLDRYKLQRDSIHVHVFKSNVIVAFTFKLAADHSRHLMVQLSLSKNIVNFFNATCMELIYLYCWPEKGNKFSHFSEEETISQIKVQIRTQGTTSISVRNYR